MTPEELADFKEWKVPLPSRSPHGTDSYERPASEQLQKLKPRNWRLEGNRLIADTDFGPLINYIPSNLILTGIDAQGLPILTEIKL